jgi:formylglycine-generating enzyme required for sulfatase activity
VATFTLDRTEVTVDAYARCVAAQACDPASTGPGYNWAQPGRERHPINGVSASMAERYCEWVGARLPSEREWAWAACGREENRPFPWGGAPPTCELAVMTEDRSGCGLGHTADVGSRPEGRSRDGVLDLAGNVAEWVENSATGPTEVWAVVVGGGFSETAGSLGLDHRLSRLPPHFTVNTSIGFRCASNGAK